MTPREQNILDGGAPFYRNYACKDGRYISFGAIEPQFYAELLEKLELDFGGTDYSVQLNKAEWPTQRQRIAERVREKTLDEWMAIFDGGDACAAPVLKMRDAANHPHNLHRRNLLMDEGRVQTAVAPALLPYPGCYSKPTCGWRAKTVSPCCPSWVTVPNSVNRCLAAVP